MPHYPKITSKKMKYPSPSGYVYTGKYVLPFQPVKNGFGFMGVILEDSKSGKINCSVCNGWYGVFNSHLRTHGIDSKEYRERFGLSFSTALKSKKVRLRQSEVMIKLRKQKKFQGKFKRNNTSAGNMKDKKHSAETKNKYGVCDLQIADRVLKLKKELKKTPTLIDLRETYGAGFIHHIGKRYGSYVKYCQDLELEPHISNHNPKYSKEYFIEKGLSNEPSVKIFTENEKRALYKYFKSYQEWKDECKRIKNGN